MRRSGGAGSTTATWPRSGDPRPGLLAALRTTTHRAAEGLWTLPGLTALWKI